MSESTPTRRPIVRRVMAVLFALMMIPILGWYFLGDFASRELWIALPDAQQALWLDVHRAVRFKLVATLFVSVIAFALSFVYVRRTALDPITRLSRQARNVTKGSWVAPPELGRPDEIGDLARAIDAGVRSLEDRADEASRFASNLSHELRTPLAAIRGAAELLTEDDLTPEERRRFVNHALAEAQRLERLVDGILDIARAEQRHLAVHEPIVDASDVVRAASGAVAPLLRRKQVVMDFKPSGKPCRVMCDPDRLQRILFGLFENAIRFSPTKGRILVETRWTDGEVVTTIADRGPGIPPELVSKIFERQFTAEHDGGNAMRGTGLGLAIVRSLVSLSGGRVWAEANPGGGARFAFALPASDAIGPADSNSETETVRRN